MSNDVSEIFVPVVEYFGRRKLPPQINFSANEILSPAYLRRVHWLTKATYINLTPKLYAVAIAPDGKPILLKGGINHPLPSGSYIIHYIVKEHRQVVIPKVSETTIDGAQVSLELIINYRVADPIKALEVEQPVETLIAFIKADLQEYIRSHTYDELLGDGLMRRIDDGSISRYIKEKHHTRHQLSKLFFIADIAVEEKTGDPKLMEIRESYQVQHRQNTTENELLKQKQELEKKVALQDAEIKRIKMESDATRQEVFQKLNNELENLRTSRELQQDKVRRGLDAIAKYLEPSTYPRDPQIAQVAMELLHEINIKVASQVGTDNVQEEEHATAPETGPQRMDNLTDTLLRWLERK
jgi:hypothetical protein